MEEQTERTYTLSQIKAAYWAQFHEAGELWFTYLSTPEVNEEATQSEWELFLEKLEMIANG